MDESFHRSLSHCSFDDEFAPITGCGAPEDAEGAFSLLRDEFFSSPPPQSQKVSLPCLAAEETFPAFLNHAAARTFPRKFAGASQATAEALEHVLKQFPDSATTSWELDTQVTKTSDTKNSCVVTLVMTIGDVCVDKKQREKTELVDLREKKQVRAHKEQPKKKPVPVPAKPKMRRTIEKKPSPFPSSASEKEIQPPPKLSVPEASQCIFLSCSCVATRTLGLCDLHRKQVFSKDTFVSHEHRALLYGIFQYLTECDLSHQFVLLNNSAEDALVWRGLSPFSRDGAVGVPADTNMDAMFKDHPFLIVSRTNPWRVSLKTTGEEPSVYLYKLEKKTDLATVPFANMRWKIFLSDVEATDTYAVKFFLKRPIPLGLHFIAPEKRVSVFPAHEAASGGETFVLADKLHFAELGVTRVPDFLLFYALAARFYRPLLMMPGPLFSDHVTHPRYAVLYSTDPSGAITCVALASVFKRDCGLFPAIVCFLHALFWAPESDLFLYSFLATLKKALENMDEGGITSLEFELYQELVLPPSFLTSVQRSPLQREGYMRSDLLLHRIPIAKKDTNTALFFSEYVPLTETQRSSGPASLACKMLEADAMYVREGPGNETNNFCHLYDLMALKYVTAVRFLEFVYPPGSLPGMLRSIASATLFPFAAVQADAQKMAQFLPAAFHPRMEPKEYDSAVAKALSVTYRPVTRLRNSYPTVTQNKQKQIQEFEAWVRLALGLRVFIETCSLIKGSDVLVLCPLRMPKKEGIPA